MKSHTDNNGDKDYVIMTTIITEASSSAAAAATAGAAAAAAGRVLASLAGPWEFSAGGARYEEWPFEESTNPTSSFSVSLWARCDGGRGYRSPLTSRDESGADADRRCSGYMFYADADDRWTHNTKT